MDIWFVVICASNGFMLNARPLSNEKMSETEMRSVINLRHSIFASSALARPLQVKSGLVQMVVFVKKMEAIEMVLIKPETCRVGLAVIGSVI